MERLLARLERRIGGYAIPNLTAIIVAGMATVFVAGSMRPGLIPILALDVDAVRAGEVWRLFTFLFLPRTMDPLSLFFSLGIVWFVGSTLEANWGSFRFNLFYLLGCIGTAIAAYVTHEPETNRWLNWCLMLSLGTLFPDEELNLFLVFPVKVSWIAAAIGAYLGYSFLNEGVAVRAAILAALAVYFLFCGSALLALLRGRRLAVRQAARRSSVAPVEAAVSGSRTCAMCGVSEADGADIRVCSCEKCGGVRNLCLSHARAH